MKQKTASFQPSEEEWKKQCNDSNLETSWKPTITTSNEILLFSTKQLTNKIKDF